MQVYVLLLLHTLMRLWAARHGVLRTANIGWPHIKRSTLSPCLHDLEQQQQQPTPGQQQPCPLPISSTRSPIEAVADGGARAHELEQQQQGLGGHAKRAGVHESEERVCRMGIERAVNE